MDLSIRSYIKNNFKTSDEKEIRNSIETSVNEGEEEALPGMGVFMEILWQNSLEDTKKQIISNIKKGIK